MIILTPNPNYKFVARDHESHCDELVIRETWVENVYQIELGDFHSSKLMIDLGANIGSVSLYAVSLDPEVKVIAYEPQLDNYNLLLENIELNGATDRITVVKKAVSNTRGTLGISNDLGNSHLTKDKAAEQVELITLEDVLDGIEECDVLKIDVEGAEYEIITGASDETLNKIRYLTLEFSNTTKNKFGGIIATLSRCFNLHIIGSYERGGQIYGRRY